MRIIAGEWRSRVLKAPPGSATRPTSDRLRETLFNVLSPRVVGARFVDLYAGSGAVGLEALSRGAAHCTFVERAAPALAALRANVQALNVPAARLAIVAKEVAAALRGGTAASDIFFLDPPYEVAAAYRSTLNALASASLSHEAIVVTEHAAPKSRTGVNDLEENYGALQRTRLLVQGDAALSFYEAHPLQ